MEREMKVADLTLETELILERIFVKNLKDDVMVLHGDHEEVMKPKELISYIYSVIKSFPKKLEEFNEKFKGKYSEDELTPVDVLDLLKKQNLTSYKLIKDLLNFFNINVTTVGKHTPVFA